MQFDLTDHEILTIKIALQCLEKDLNQTGMVRESIKSINQKIDSGKSKGKYLVCLAKDVNENYSRGFHNGKLDKMSGICLQVALSSSIPGYSEGYRDGQNSTKDK